MSEKIKVLNKKKAGRKSREEEADICSRIDRTVLTMDNLIDTIERAKRLDVKFFVTQVKMPGIPTPEIIMNPIKNADAKIEYYRKAYNEDLTLKACSDVQIVNFTFGDTWTEVRCECLL